MSMKHVSTSAIGMALALGLSYPIYAQTERTGDVTGAVGDVTDKAGDVTGEVTGKAGEATANQGKQNENVGRNQKTGTQVARQESRQANFGNLISALNNVSAQVENVQALNNVNVVDVVDVNNVATGNNVQALNNALNRNDVEISVLRNAINQNHILSEALKNANVAVTDVVAVNVLSGGDVVVFTR
jgi:hypothetical protein